MSYLRFRAAELAWPRKRRLQQPEAVVVLQTAKLGRNISTDS